MKTKDISKHSRILRKLKHAFPGLVLKVLFHYRISVSLLYLGDHSRQKHSEFTNGPTPLSSLGRPILNSKSIFLYIDLLDF